MERALPQHIAIIMDGNGRWAKKRLLPKKLGHKAGADALKKLVENIQKNNNHIKHITVYAFSTENWKRSTEEVNDLMTLLKQYVKQYIKENEKSDLKIDTIGDIDILDEELKNEIRTLEKISANKTGINLHIAFNYGGRDEIIRGIKKLYNDISNNSININQINEQKFSSYLDTKDYKDPELIIRTSGEIRLSNFLIWQSAYSEFYFTDKLWPDFNYNDLIDAINVYMNRERRFGGRIEE